LVYLLQTAKLEAPHHLTTTRYHQSPSPNNSAIFLRPRLRQQNPQKRRPTRILQGHPNTTHRHWRMRIRPVWRLPLRTSTIRASQPQQTLHPCTQLWSVLRRRSIRRHHQHLPKRANRTCKNQTANSAPWRQPTLLRPTRLYQETQRA
jgi:hypothetical protein